MMEKEAQYFSKDFEWEDLKHDIENDVSFRFHLLPFQSPSSSSSSSSSSADPLSQNAEDSTSWQKFHSRHYTGKFFKERRYLLKEFPELGSCGKGLKVLEVGCGNGSTVVPILRGNENITVYACDCSVEALENAKGMVDTLDMPSVTNRFHAFHCDFSCLGFPMWLACSACRKTSPYGAENTEAPSNGSVSSKTNRCCLGGVNFVTLIFTLSAVPFCKMPSALAECFSILKPGGMLLFRDYGLYDMTMLRFEIDKRVGFREYMRGDGTRSYFFSLETVRDLFTKAGFIELELEYCCVKSLNRKNGKSMHRVWVHGKFQKPG